MSDIKKEDKRSLKRLWVNPRYQSRVILGMVLTGLTLVVFQSLVFYVFTLKNYQLLVDVSQLPEEIKSQLYGDLRRVILMFGAGSLIFLGFVALLGLVYSHRTAGPLYHFKRVFDVIKSGKRDERVRLRPRDDFREVAEAFNEMMDTMK